MKTKKYNILILEMEQCKRFRKIHTKKTIPESPKEHEEERWDRHCCMYYQFIYNLVCSVNITVNIAHQFLMLSFLPLNLYPVDAFPS